MEHDWDTRDLTASVCGPSREFGLEDLSPEGFHDQIILEMVAQALVFDVFLLLGHDFLLVYSLFSSIPLSFGAHLLVVHRVLQSNFLPGTPIPGELTLASSRSFWNLLLWRSYAGIFRRFLAGLSFFSELDNLLITFSFLW